MQQDSDGLVSNIVTLEVKKHVGIDFVFWPKEKKLSSLDGDRSNEARWTTSIQVDRWDRSKSQGLTFL